MKRDYSISFIRICAMSFIVICHLGSHFEQTAMAQFFNVGIQIFFLISGYLYGNKRIENTGLWLYKRYVRLEVPALLWLAIVCVSAWLRHNNLPALHECVFLLLNLQGLNFIFSSMQDLFRGPWFFTNIMCCYILLICYLRIEEKHPGFSHVFDYGGIVPLAIFIMLAMCRISTDGALAFFIGFNLKRRGFFDTHRKYNILIAFSCFMAAVAIRLLGKRLIDGSIFYDEVIAPGTHVLIAAAFVVGVKWLFGVAPRLMDSISKSPFMQHLDKISIYVYISHDMLFGIFALSLPLPVLAVLFVAEVITVATVLWFIGEYATRQIDRAVNYLFI